MIFLQIKTLSGSKYKKWEQDHSVLIFLNAAIGVNVKDKQMSTDNS